MEKLRRLSGLLHTNKGGRWGITTELCFTKETTFLHTAQNSHPVGVFLVTHLLGGVLVIERELSVGNRFVVPPRCNRGGVGTVNQYLYRCDHIPPTNKKAQLFRVRLCLFYVVLK